VTVQYHCTQIYYTRSRGSSVGKSERPGFDSRQVQDIFLCSTASRPALGPTQPRIQWVPGALSPEVKRPEREAYHSPPSSAEVKKVGAIPPLPHTFYGVVLN
jgi:hypothetical protein